MVPKEVAALLEDFDALASSLAVGVVDVRGCLIVSRDGLVLGAYPADAEITVGPAWVRFGDLGDPERGFAQFGTETWCYVRRGPYAGFAVVGPGARPGLVIDHMDQALLAAEQARSRHEGVRGDEAAVTAPVSKPGSHLHREQPALEQEPMVIDAPDPIPIQAWLSELADEDPRKPASDEEPRDHSASWEPISPPRPDVPAEPAAWESPDRATDEPEDEPEDELGSQPDRIAREEPWRAPKDASRAERGDESEPDPKERPAYGEESEPPDDADEEDIDRFSLAREFGQLLQHREDAADG